MHTERDIVLPIILSVCPTPVLCKHEWTCSHTFDTPVGASHHSGIYKIQRGTPSAGALNTKGWETFADIANCLRNGTR